MVHNTAGFVLLLQKQASMRHGILVLCGFGGGDAKPVIIVQKDVLVGEGIIPGIGCKRDVVKHS